MSGWTKPMADEHNRKVAMKTAEQHNSPIVGQAHGTIPIATMDEDVRVSFQRSTDESKLNKTEYSFWCELKSRTHIWVGCQNITLKLADDCRYTPDFSFIGPDGRVVFFEVKGFWRDDAKVKIQVAARQFRWAAFIVVQKTKLGWTETAVKP